MRAARREDSVRRWERLYTLMASRHHAITSGLLLGGCAQLMLERKAGSRTCARPPYVV